MMTRHARCVAPACAFMIAAVSNTFGGQCVSEWTAVQGPTGIGVFGLTNAFAVFDDGSGPALYSGGDFTHAGGVPAANIARWDGTAWSALTGSSGNGLSSWAYALVDFDDGSGPALYVGGRFTTAGGVDIGRGIARWDGSDWSAVGGSSGVGLGDPFNSGDEVRALAVFDGGSGPALYAGGAFGSAGGVDIGFGIARWNGSEWSPLTSPDGNGLAGPVEALAVFDDGSGPALYVGGHFTFGAGVEAEIVNNIVRWDGQEWSPLPGPSGNGVTHIEDGFIPSVIISRVRALRVFDDGTGPALYVGGQFDSAGGVATVGVARWDGSTWSAVPGLTSSPCSCGGVWALSVFDDGTGPALYAGGSLASAGDTVLNGIARWDGSSWRDLFGPIDAGVSVQMVPLAVTVRALAVFVEHSTPSLFAGGNFFRAGGVAVSAIARWNGCQPPPCPCDFDADGHQTVSDYFAFLTAFFAQFGGPGTADVDGDGEVTVSDYFDFVGTCLPSIAAGLPCP